MKWLKSTTDKSYTAQGKIIPSSTSNPLAVADDVYAKIAEMPVIKSLIKTGSIIVLDKFTPTANTVDSQTRALQTLNEENTKLHDRIRELEASNSDKALKEANKRIKELEAKYAELEAEANAKIAELSKGAND